MTQLPPPPPRGVRCHLAAGHQVRGRAHAAARQRHLHEDSAGLGESMTLLAPWNQSWPYEMHAAAVIRSPTAHAPALPPCAPAATSPTPRRCRRRRWWWWWWAAWPTSGSSQRVSSWPHTQSRARWPRCAGAGGVVVCLACCPTAPRRRQWLQLLLGQPLPPHLTPPNPSCSPAAVLHPCRGRGSPPGQRRRAYRHGHPGTHLVPLIRHRGHRLTGRWPSQPTPGSQGECLQLRCCRRRKNARRRHQPH